MKNRHILISAITAGLLLSACGGGGGGDSQTSTSQTEQTTQIAQTKTKVAYLVDAPIVGAGYLVDGAKNYTQMGGSFKYDSENISFYLGDILLGSIDKIPDDKVVLLQDILGIDRNDLTNEKLIKIATLLQSLDNDTSTRSIEITKNTLIGSSYDKSIDDIDIDEVLNQNSVSKKSAAEVAKHLRETLDNVTDTSLPTLSSIYPADGQRDVELDVQIELKFSKFLRYDTFLDKISIKDTSGNEIKFNTYLSENVMILKPTNLQKSTTYTINIDGVKDYNSNNSTNISFNFSTTSSERSSVDTSSGASAVSQIEHEGEGSIGTESSSSSSGNTNFVNSSEITDTSSAVKTTITATTSSYLAWDKATIYDTIGRIEDYADLDVVKVYGMTNFGNSLSTSERVVSLDGKNNIVVAGSQYHNALNVINYNQGTYNYNKFASFRPNYSAQKGGLLSTSSSGSSSSSGGSSSGGTDTSSGASGRSLTRALSSDESCSSAYIDKYNSDSLWEHTLTDAKITSDGGYVYALVMPRFSVEEYSSNSTFGLFRTKVGYCGVNPYNASSTNRVDSRGISKIELSDNDKMLAAYGETDSQNILRVYNSTLTSVISAKNLDNLASFDFAFNDASIVGVISQTYTEQPKLVKYSTSNLSVQGEKTLPFSADTVLGTKDRVIVLSKSKALVASFDEDLNMLKEIKVDFVPTKTAISPNGTYLALGNDSSVHVYDINDSSITKLTTSSVNGLRALSFINNSLLAYTPKISANSVVTLKLEKSTSKEESENNTTQVVETLEELGSFSSLSSVTSTNIYGTTKLVTSSGNRVLSYTQIASDDKGYNVFDVSLNTFKFTEGSKSSVDKFYRDEVMGMKLLSEDSFVVVSVNKNTPAFSTIYVQDVRSDGTLEDSHNITVVTDVITIGNYGTPQSAKIAKSSNYVFVTKKALVEKYYLVDIYKPNGKGYSKVQTDIPLEHLTTYINSVAPTDSGNDFYSVGSDKLIQNSTNKSVEVKNANGVFYGANLVLVTTSDGKLYTYDKDLESKKAYKFDLGNVKDMQTSGNSIVVFSENGVYVLDVQNGTLKANKSMSVSNLASGYVDGNRIFAISNSPYSSVSPNTSEIIYLTF